MGAVEVVLGKDFTSVVRFDDDESAKAEYERAINRLYKAGEMARDLHRSFNEAVAKAKARKAKEQGGNGNG
jgi:hypothetical protein